MKARIVTNSKPEININHDILGTQAKSGKENIFIDKISKKNSSKNIFKALSNRLSIKRFIKNIKNGSPGFDILWQMADFIRLAGLIFQYRNNPDNKEIGLFSSNMYGAGTNGFVVNDINCTIKIKLFYKSRQVVLEVDRVENNADKTNITFTDEQWEQDPSLYDEMLLEQVIKIINKRIIMLFEFCYDMR